METKTSQAKAKHLLKSELGKRDISYPELVRHLSKIGRDETVASVTNKINRGSFSASFLIDCMMSIGIGKIDIPFPERPSSSNGKTVQEREIDSQYTFSFNGQEEFEPSFFYDSVEGHSYINIRNTPLFSLSQNKIISLFTGAGGLDIGLEAAGFETAICVELDEDCRETLRYNRPEWKLFEDDQNPDGEKRTPGDIRQIEADELLDAAGLEKGEAALVTGGAPCQPFSNIGKRKGKNDPKNGDLFQDFVRVVRGAMPRAFIFENVSGITQSRHQEVIDYMTSKFEGLGYSLSWTKLNAADYGVPQKRIRFFLIGLLGEHRPAFPLPTHYRSQKRWEEFASRLNDDPDYSPDDWVSVGDAFSQIPDNIEERFDYVQMNNTEKVKHRMTYIGPGENFHVVPDKYLPNCWKSGKHQGQDTFGRMEIDKPSHTIRTAAYNPSKGQYIHPTEDRGLNSYEMAVLQGFHPDWEFRIANRSKMTLKSAGNQIGNAVPPPLAKALGKALSIQFMIRQQA